VAFRVKWLRHAFADADLVKLRADKFPPRYAVLERVYRDYESSRIEERCEANGGDGRQENRLDASRFDEAKNPSLPDSRCQRKDNRGAAIAVILFAADGDDVAAVS
jgi:hypothetical protein